MAVRIAKWFWPSFLYSLLRLVQGIAKSKSISTNICPPLRSSWFVTSGPQKKKFLSYRQLFPGRMVLPGMFHGVSAQARARAGPHRFPLHLLSFPLFFRSVFGLHFACVRPIFLKASTSAHCLRTLSFCGLEELQFRHLFSREIQLLLKEFPTGRGVFFLSPLQSSKLELLVEPISDEERRRRRRRRRRSKSAFSSVAKFLW